MLTTTNRLTSHDADAALVQRTREELRSTAANRGDSSGTANSVSWFDGTKTRGVFLPGLSRPDSDTYVPPPRRVPGLSNEERLLNLRLRYTRLRMLF